MHLLFFFLQFYELFWTDDIIWCGYEPGHYTTFAIGSTLRHSQVNATTTMTSAGSSSSSSLRGLYSTPHSSWSFSPSVPDNGSSSASTSPSQHPSQSAYQWTTRPKQNSIMDLSPGLRMEPNAPNFMLLLKAACASAVLTYASGVVEVPWEVGRTLLQVQYVPRDAKAVEDIDDESSEEAVSFCNKCLFLTIDF